MQLSQVVFELYVCHVAIWLIRRASLSLSISHKLAWDLMDLQNRGLRRKCHA